jgi:hypothetical protein
MIYVGPTQQDNQIVYLFSQQNGLQVEYVQ